MNETASQIGETLVREREASGLSQAEAGQQLGVDKQTISRWERGERRPRADMYERAIELYRTTALRRFTQLDQIVSRGTSPGELSPSSAKRVRDFEREAARLGATDDELDHIAESLTRGSSRKFYLGGKGEEEAIEDLIAGLRVWLERRIERRQTEERRRR